MDLSKPSTFRLQGKDLEALKRELEGHLVRMSIRQPREPRPPANKMPMGFGLLVEAESSAVTYFPFTLGGSITDFMSLLPPSTKELYIKITLMNSGVSQRVEQRLQDEYRAYTIQLNIPKLSVAKIELINKSNVAVEAIIGFTFQEDRDNAIRTTELIGNL